MKSRGNRLNSVLVLPDLGVSCTLVYVRSLYNPPLPPLGLCRKRKAEKDTTPRCRLERTWKGRTRVLCRAISVVATTRGTAIRKPRNCSDCGAIRSQSLRVWRASIFFVFLWPIYQPGNRLAMASGASDRVARYTFLALVLENATGIFSRLLGVACEDKEGLADNLSDTTNCRCIAE